MVVGRNGAYFVREDTKSHDKYTDDDIIKMLNFLIDNVFVQFGGQLFQQTVGIPMGTNCAPLLADLFLYSYEAEFIDGLKKKDKKLARSFNFSFRYIDDVLSLNNSRFADYVNVIYPNELEIKDTTDSPKSACYLDLHLEIDSRGELTTKLFDKRDSFNFHIVNFSLFWVAISHQLPHMACTFRSSYVILEHVIYIKTFLTGHACWLTNYSIKDLSTPVWSCHYRNFMVVTMSWLIGMESPFLKWNRIFSLDHNEPCLSPI